MKKWDDCKRRVRARKAEQAHKAKALETDMTLAPRELKMPEPFYSALIGYFHADNVKNLNIEDIDSLRRDLVNIALNLCDGKKHPAARMLQMGHGTIYLYMTKYDLHAVES